MFYQPKNGHGLPHNPFKAIVSPRPIAWISTLDAKGRANLAPYSFFNAMADNPPIVVFGSTGGKADQPQFKDTMANIRETGEFVVNIVSYAMKDAMNITSGDLPADIDEFEAAGLEKAASQIVQPPRVAAAPAALECKLFKFVDLIAENSAMVIGEVVGIHMDDRNIVNGMFDVTTYQPLARLGYMDYSRVSETFSLQRPKQEQ
ncbi:MAG: flavin reductase family protein [Rhodobacteraceae bacterium]|nr:flavin reductase family protein [Paracoccaceae bacterium]